MNDHWLGYVRHNEELYYAEPPIKLGGDRVKVTLKKIIDKADLIIAELLDLQNNAISYQDKIYTYHEVRATFDGTTKTLIYRYDIDRTQLAAKMVQPLRRVMYPTNISRKLLMVDTLPQGALARYTTRLTTNKL
jgi:hypothetical protein